jgi:4-amino-4-deoxy-L-arabinose transferase-like glycosyltransferase
LTENTIGAWRWIRRAAIFLYVTLALATIATREPWCDEAWFNGPALTLGAHGYMGTPYLDPASNIGKPQIHLDGINRYTYWMPPLYMVAQAAWIKIVGFGLFHVRLASLLWGLAALFAWWIVAERLAGKLAASLSVLLLGVEYNWIYAAADARMEMMCAALGTVGLACYLVYRERDLTRALLLANCAIAAAALTHPMGVLYVLALVVIAFLSERSRLAWLHLPFSAAPYVVALAAWGAYIAQAPQLFLVQFTGNATGRGPGIAHPWTALKVELAHRYGESFGMASWTSGPARLKILVLLVYFAGLVWVTASRRLRSTPGIKLAWAAGSSILVFCWLLEGSKNFMYLPHILPWLCILAAIAFCDLAGTARRAATLVVLAVVAIQVLSTAMPAWRNQYGHLFVPAMAYLRQHSTAEDTILADAVVGFELGFERRVIDDTWLGYKTGKKPDWLVITPVYASMIESMPQFHPDVSRHITQFLEQYRLAYQNEGYRIYVRKDSTAASRA